MAIHLFNARRLARELSLNQVGPRDRGYYLLASFLMFTLFYYSGLMYANPLWSALSIYEGVVITLITFFGLAKAYEAAGGDENRDFVVQFTCLYVPVSITTILVVWPLFWGTTIIFRESIKALSGSHLQFAINLSRIGGDFFGVLTFLAAVAVQGVTFYRITRLFSVVRSQGS
jgi:hypothetical protein